MQIEALLNCNSTWFSMNSLVQNHRKFGGTKPNIEIDKELDPALAAYKKYTIGKLVSSIKRDISKKLKADL